MSRSTTRIHLVLLAGTLVCAAGSVSLASWMQPDSATAAKPAAPLAASAPEAGDDIVARIEALTPPKPDRAKMSADPKAREEFTAARDEFLKQQTELIAQLLAKNPDHSKAGRYATLRWSLMAQKEKYVELKAETAKFTDRKDKMGSEASFMYAMSTCEVAKWELGTSLKAVDAFIAKYPGDERAATILSELADNAEGSAQKKEIYARMAKDFPNSRATKAAVAKTKQIEGLGQPFVFKFTDAITGKEVSNETLKGKVLVIDFWATWCGPCVADMPKLKTLYAEFKSKGVEFVGISLDQPEDKGGLTKLKEFVAKNDIAWPQYFQGNFWQSEFSSSWGINSIPALFVVDADGNLASTNARGKLEELLSTLIAKRDGKK